MTPDLPADLTVQWIAVVVNRERNRSATRSGATPEAALAAAMESYERGEMGYGRLAAWDIANGSSKHAPSEVFMQLRLSLLKPKRDIPRRII